MLAQPAWDRIASEFKGSAAVLIGDVDCTLYADLCRYDIAALCSTTFISVSWIKEGASGPLIIVPLRVSTS